MAKITQAQIDRLTAQVPNGWKLDTSALLSSKDKVLRKRIPLGGRAFLCASLRYTVNWDTQTPDLVLWLCVAHEETDRKGRVCEVSFWRTWGTFETNCAKRDFKKLCRVAATITDDDVRFYARGYRECDDEYYKMQRNA